jgi:hypothetical protein
MVLIRIETDEENKSGLIRQIMSHVTNSNVNPKTGISGQNVASKPPQFKQSHIPLNEANNSRRSSIRVPDKKDRTAVSNEPKALNTSPGKPEVDPRKKVMNNSVNKVDNGRRPSLKPLLVNAERKKETMTNESSNLHQLGDRKSSQKQVHEVSQVQSSKEDKESNLKSSIGPRRDQKENSSKEKTLVASKASSKPPKEGDKPTKEQNEISKKLSGTLSL